MDKTQKRITTAAIIIVALVIIVILILTIIGSGGISIQDIKNNPEKYLDKTITLTASYSGINGYLLQEDLFGNTEGIKVVIGDDVDISMLLHGREYHWTGTVVQITNNGNIYLRFIVQELETLYEDDGRHDTSKLIGP